MTELLRKLLKQKEIIEEHIECLSSFEAETTGELDESLAAMDRFAEFLSDTQSLNQ